MVCTVIIMAVNLISQSTLVRLFRENNLYNACVNTINCTNHEVYCVCISITFIPPQPFRNSMVGLLIYMHTRLKTNCLGAYLECYWNRAH